MTDKTRIEVQDHKGTVIWTGTVPVNLHQAQAWFTRHPAYRHVQDGALALYMPVPKDH